MIQYLITSGCSFSTYTWTKFIEKKYKDYNPNLVVEHVALPSQGQELIQKKASLAIMEALEKGYDSSQILVLVMWSGTDRKSWYIDNIDTIDGIVHNWKTNFESGWYRQFYDLKNKSNASKIVTTKSNARVEYNPEGGWYITNGPTIGEIDFVKQFYMFSREAGGIGFVHESIENIIFLQNLCKIKNINFVQQFYMDVVFEDIVKNRDHQAINYLYKQLDHDTMITQGMYDYLKTNKEYFTSDNFHPNDLGSETYTNNILIPFLKQKGFFK